MPCHAPHQPRRATDGDPLDLGEPGGGIVHRRHHPAVTLRSSPDYRTRKTSIRTPVGLRSPVPKNRVRFIHA